MPGADEARILPYSPRHRSLAGGRRMSGRGQPMIDRFGAVARAVVAVLVLGMAGAAAQTGQAPASPSPGQAPRARAPSPAPAPAQPPRPQIDKADITPRANPAVDGA